MAPTKGVRAGKAYVELFAEDRKLARGLKRASRRLKAFGAGVRRLGLQAAAAGAAMLAPLLAASKAFASLGDTLGKMAKRTGLSVESLSELQFAAEQSGADVATLEKGVRTMQRSINDLGRDLSTAVDAFGDLGLTMTDLQGLSPEAQFKLIADRMAQIPDPSKRAALAMQIFGRAGTRLLPMMARGAAGMEALQAEARALGLTISTEDAAAAEELTDTINRLLNVLKRAAFAVGAALAPALTDAANWIRENVSAAIAWIKANGELIVTTLKWVAGIAAAGAALVVLGTVISSVGAILGALAALPAFAAFGLIAAAVGGVVLAYRAFTAATKKLSTEMADLLDKGDAQRAADLDTMERLEALAKKTRLNNAEMAEARGLIDDLQGRYGALGLTLDTVANKLAGVADAQERLTKAMRADAMNELLVAAYEAEQQLADLDRKMVELGKRHAVFHFGDPGDFERAVAQYDEARKRLTRFRQRIAALEAGDRAGLTAGAKTPAAGGAPGPAAGGGAADAAKKRADAVKRLAAIEDERHRKSLTNAQREVKAIQDRLAEEKKHLMVLGKYLEIADREKRAAAEVAAVWKQAAAERRAARLQGEQKLQDELARLRIEATTEGAERELALLKLQHQKEFAAAKKASRAPSFMNLLAEKFQLMSDRIKKGAAAFARPMAGARGTFNPAAVRALAGGRGIDQVAENTKETAKQVRKIEKNTREQATYK